MLIWGFASIYIAILGETSSAPPISGMACPVANLLLPVLVTVALALLGSCRSTQAAIL